MIKSYYCDCGEKTEIFGHSVPKCCGNDMKRDYKKVNISCANGTKKSWPDQKRENA